MKNKNLEIEVITFYAITAVLWISVIVGVGYLLLNPEIIGHWFRRLMSGF